MSRRPPGSRIGVTTGKIDPRYGDPSASVPPWAVIERLLTDAQLYWIITVRADGRPHAAPVVGVWQDAAFAFCTGSTEQKQRNLEANGRVAVTTGSTGAKGWNSGKDVVVEGTAVRVTDPAALQGLAAAWGAKYGEGWGGGGGRGGGGGGGGGQGGGRAARRGGGGGAGGGGAPGFYRVTPAKVLAF